MLWYSTAILSGANPNKLRTRRRMSIRAILLLFPLMACALAAAQSKAPKSKLDAKAIHESAIVIDTHADTPQRFLDENFDMGSNTPISEGHMDIGKRGQGNLAAEFFSIWV